MVIFQSYVKLPEGNHGAFFFWVEGHGRSGDKKPDKLDAGRRGFFEFGDLLVGGIPCYTYTPLKNDGVKVSWDDDIPKMMGKYNSCSKAPSGLTTINHY